MNVDAWSWMRGQSGKIFDIMTYALYETKAKHSITSTFHVQSTIYYYRDRVLKKLINNSASSFGSKHQEAPLFIHLFSFIP